ncbi:mechanosensitive ion channel family protein [Arcobacter aquimarinus]|uniref:mechanosensitive ion channel family protein n=1 Tax=Arcobacter aquimarinus TaxID=1315211 RepID=UPI003BB1B6F3
MFKIFKPLLIIFLLQNIIYSQEIVTSPIKLMSKEVSSNTATPIEQSNTQELSQSIEEQIDKQNRLVEEVINNINNESYLITLANKEQYENDINFLTNRINANKIQKNSLAIARDELKIFYLKHKIEYEQSLKSIIIGKQEFKDKKFFEDLLQRNIKSLEDFKIDDYTALYESEIKNVNNKISMEFIDNYIEIYNQKHTQLFILQYLYSNIKKFRASNFFIDEFNLKYIINKIDSLKGISFVSSLTSYHLNFSIGELFVVLMIIIFFRLLNRYLIVIITSFISKIFIQNKNTREEESILFNLKEAINSPLIYSLYLFSIQLSIFIIVKDQNFINAIMPWINTIYIALLTWAVYAILNIAINIYAQNLLEKYQNVRKEMIVFILKIIKVVLIILVILFLFTQLGLDVKAILASLGVGGIAIALAAKDTLANFFASLNIMTDNSFSQGDWIKTSDFEGTVVDIRMRTTRIRTFDNAMITVPNSQIANAHILNWSKRIIGRRIKMNISITYESKMEDILNLKRDIYDMLSNHPKIATNQNINISRTRAFEAIKREDLEGIKNTLLVFIDEYSSSSIDILVYCFSKSPNWEDWLITKEEVIVEISKLVEKNNCEFAYPAQTIFLKKENEMKKEIEEI